jgi:hypothetical protein
MRLGKEDWLMSMLRNVMWNMFQDTGNINAYLFYCGCTQNEFSEHEAAQKEAEEIGEARENN